MRHMWRKPEIKKNQYQCALCGGIFGLIRDDTWSKEKAEEEYKRYFSTSSMENTDIVCDECWKLVRPQ